MVLNIFLNCLHFSILIRNHPSVSGDILKYMIILVQIQKTKSSQISSVLQQYRISPRVYLTYKTLVLIPRQQHAKIPCVPLTLRIHMTRQIYCTRLDRYTYIIRTIINHTTFKWINISLSLSIFLK